MKFIIRHWDILTLVLAAWISAAIIAYNLYHGLYGTLSGGM